MKYKTYTVEIITPTIMGGADSGKLDPYKIRTSEIKSAMRQVFRMVAGKYIDHSPASIKLLLEKEGEIFGSTSGKSTFKIWTEGTENLKTQKIKLLPHKEKIGTVETYCIDVNQSFKLNLYYFSENYTTEFFEALLRVAFLLGIGRRKNRLMGNMKIVEEKEVSLTESISIIDNVIKPILEKNPYYADYIDEPAFSSFSKRSNAEKNFKIVKVKLDDGFIINKDNLENLLKRIYKNIINKIEKDFKEHEWILPSKNFIGEIKSKFFELKKNGETDYQKNRQSSFINFSLNRENENTYLYLFAFYYTYPEITKLEKDYVSWQKAMEEIKECLKKEFKTELEEVEL